MKTFVTALMVAATLAGGLAASTGTADAQEWRRHGPGGYHGGWNGGYRHHHRGGGGGGGDAAAAAALGLVGGMILGGIAAQSAPPSYVYEDEPYVARRPAPRVYYDDDYRRPTRGARCRTLIKYDMYGKPYEYKDCDP